MYRRQLYFARKLFNVSEDIQEKLLSYHPVCGGIDNNGLVTDETLVETDMYNSDSIIDEVAAVVSNGVTSYTTYLAAQFPNFRNEITKRSVLNSIISGFGIRKKTLSIEKVDLAERRHMRAMQGAWKHMSGIALINRVRMGVSNIIVIMSAISPERAATLSKVAEPITWLALLLK